MKASNENVLSAARDGRAALRQLTSLARSKCLIVRDFDRLTAKVARAFDVLPSRDGGALVRRLQAMAANRCLVDVEFDAIAGRLAREFEAFMGRDPVGADSPAFHVVNGGRP